MSINGAMWAGLSGLNATSTSLAVTGDNIANVNTVGYRGSRAQFEDMLTRNIFGVGQIGSGVRISSVQKLFEQGSIVGTTSQSDMAITGRGFFVTRGNFNGRTGNFFTRAGQFIPDKEGYLVNPQGLRLQGYNADQQGTIGTVPGDLLAAQPFIDPVATDEIRLDVTLTANRTGENPNVTGSAAANPIPTGFDLADIDNTAFFSTGLTVFDSLGKAQPVTVYFTRTAERTYQYTAVVESSRLQTPTNTQPDGTEIFAQGDITFNDLGQLDSVTPTNNNPVQFLGATAQTINFNFGDPLSTGGTGAGSKMAGGPSGDALKLQNGFAAGTFVGMKVDGEGIVTSTYSSGREKTVGRVAIADFRAMEGLERLGGTMFRQTSESGEPFIGFANTGGRGSIRGEALEQANVDISTEFVRLIRDQRAYQAHSRIITTSDELLLETVNLKR